MKAASSDFAACMSGPGAPLYGGRSFLVDAASSPRVFSTGAAPSEATRTSLLHIAREPRWQVVKPRSGRTVEAASRRFFFKSPQPSVGRVGGGRKGFTLLELLVALSMAAIVAVALFDSLRIGFKQKQIAERAVAPARIADEVMEVLRNDIQCALPPRSQMTLQQQYLQGNASGQPRVFAGPFEGMQSQDARGDEADDLVFFSTASSPLHPQGANGDIKQIELTVIQPPNSADFVLVRNTTNNLLDPQQELPDQEILCRHVYGFSLQYFDGVQWNTFWDSTQQSNSLPLAVAVVLTLDTQQKNPDGTPLLANFRRVFQLPCYGVPSTANATSGAGGSGTTGGSGSSNTGKAATLTPPAATGGAPK
ncbi:MAG TPA: type II secretion system protein GspJ [Tepidisphaeraceae bacterium]|nr:type II secretion system protein GspJ [Tepidisphaeraceae bacterium]